METITDTSTDSTFEFSSLSTCSAADHPRVLSSCSEATSEIARHHLHQRGPTEFSKRSKYSARHRRYQTKRRGASHSASQSRRICRADHSWFTPEMKYVIGEDTSILHRGQHLCSIFRPSTANKEERVFRYVTILRILRDEEAYFGDDEE